LPCPAKLGEAVNTSVMALPEADVALPEADVVNLMKPWTRWIYHGWG